jgi:hypothetical protein
MFWDRNILNFSFVTLFFLAIDFCEASVECAPPIFRKRSLFRRLGENLPLSAAGDDGDDHGHDESHHHDTKGPQILFFFCIALVLGALTSYLLQRWNSKIPYTVVMFAEGMIAAVVYMHFDKGQRRFYSIYFCIVC